MLKFLDAQHNQQPKQKVIKFLPAMAYGHTQESAPHMLNRYTVYYQSSGKKLPSIRVEASLKRPPCVKEEFNVATQLRSNHSVKPQPSTSHKETPFGIIQGEFTGFLDRHKHYNSVGKLHKEVHNKKENLQNSTCESQWNKSTNMKSKLSINSSHQKSCSTFSSFKVSTVASVMPTESVPFGRSASISLVERPANKGQIKMKRDQFAEGARMEHDIRRKTLRGAFALPSKGPSHELYFVEWPKVERKAHNERDQLNTSLEQFDRNIKKTLK